MGDSVFNQSNHRDTEAQRRQGKMINEFSGFLCVSVPLWLESCPMTETERSLLDAVLENPDDDLPRLVYADWLDENGDPKRAEFIRAQIAMAASDKVYDYFSNDYIYSVKVMSKVNPTLCNKLLNETGLPFEKPIIFTDQRSNELLMREKSNEVIIHFRRGFASALSAKIDWFMNNYPYFIRLPIEEMIIVEGGISVRYYKISKGSKFWMTTVNRGIPYLHSTRQDAITSPFIDTAYSMNI
jgi:uncharacterized protein (TIGR02996 family)